MKTIVSAAVLVCAGLGMLAAPGQSAKADESGYQFVILRNPTRSTLHYQMRWGAQGDWQTFSLPPGGREEYDASAAAPAIRFQTTPGGGGTSQSYRLRQNTHYVFRVARDGRSLALYVDNEELIVD